MFDSSFQKFKRKSIGAQIFRGIQDCVYIFGLLGLVWITYKVSISISNNSWPSIDRIVDWSQIIIAYAAIFAIGQYAVAYSDIADRKTKTVLSFVSFFREKVIEKNDEISSYLRKNDKKIPAILLRKSTRVLMFEEDEFFNKVSTNQRSVIEGYVSLIAEDPNLERMIRACINAAEEFAIGVLSSNSQNHEAIGSIKKPFVEMVEFFAVPLYYHIGWTSDQFYYVSELYKHWKNDVGFVPRTKDDIVAHYKEREKKFKQQ